MESDADEGAEFSLSSSPEEVSPDEESPSASGTLGVGVPPTACRTVFTDFRELEIHMEERGGEGRRGEERRGEGRGGEGRGGEGRGGEGTGNVMFITDNWYIHVYN